MEPERAHRLRQEYYGDNATPPSAFAQYGLQSVFEPKSGSLQAKPGKPPTLARLSMSASGTSVATARSALEAFALSVAEGKWGAYVDLMARDVTLTLPIPGRMRGIQQGAKAVEEYHRWRWEELRMRATLTQRSLLVNGATVAIEFDTLGTIGSRNSYPSLGDVLLRRCRRPRARLS